VTAYKLRRPALFILVICILAGLLPEAYSEGAATEYPDSFFAGRTWEEIIDEFNEQHNVIPGTVGAGYRNLVTGEEHYYDPDTLYLSASVYKVPLNMYWSNKVYTGEIDWEFSVKGLEYGTAIEWSILNSNNEYSIALWTRIGNFIDYRNAMLPLIGETEEPQDSQFYKENYYSVRQIIYCLNELYTNSEQYPRVLELMLRAKPGKYFKEHEHDVDIAHKFGYLFETNNVINDCGIVFTEDPIAIDVFTCNANKGYTYLVEYCDLMIAYTNYHTRIRKEQEELDARINERLDRLNSAAQAESAKLDKSFGLAEAALETALADVFVKADIPGNLTEGSENRSLAGYMLSGACAAAAILLLIAAVFSKKKKATKIIGCMVLIAAASGLVYSVYSRSVSETQRPEPVQALDRFSGVRAADTGDDNANAICRLIERELSVTASGAPELYGDYAQLRVSIGSCSMSALYDSVRNEDDAQLEEYRKTISSDVDVYADEQLASLAEDVYRCVFNEIISENTVRKECSGFIIALIFVDDKWNPVDDGEVAAGLCDAAGIDLHGLRDGRE